MHVTLFLPTAIVFFLGYLCAMYEGPWVWEWGVGWGVVGGCCTESGRCHLLCLPALAHRLLPMGFPELPHGIYLGAWLDLFSQLQGCWHCHQPWSRILAQLGWKFGHGTVRSGTPPSFSAHGSFIDHPFLKLQDDPPRVLKSPIKVFPQLVLPAWPSGSAQLCPASENLTWVLPLTRSCAWFILGRPPLWICRLFLGRHCKRQLTLSAPVLPVSPFWSTFLSCANYGDSQLFLSVGCDNLLGA